MHRKILHFDLDAFFCAVEEQRDPSLKGVAFAVGAQPHSRGIVASCSYAARKFGIRSGIPMAQAVKLCPGLVIVPRRHLIYGKTSEQCMEHLYALTPVVEKFSVDEAFLDLTHSAEPAGVLARKLQTSIRDNMGLPCSLGVATNKIVAKIANNVGKASVQTDGPQGMVEPPNAITVVPPGKEAAFLAPLPISALWGVGTKTARYLRKLGVRTIGDLARWPEEYLGRRFGVNGWRLALYARGIDDSPVETIREEKSMSKETTFSHDVPDRDILQGTLFVLSEVVGRRLRWKGVSCRKVMLKLRWPDFTTLTRQVALRDPTDLDYRIYNEAMALFEQLWRPGQAVRLLGVGASNLSPAARQLCLWNKETEKKERFQGAVDSLRERFGYQAVRSGRDILRERNSPSMSDLDISRSLSDSEASQD